MAWHKSLPMNRGCEGGEKTKTTRDRRIGIKHVMIHRALVNDVDAHLSGAWTVRQSCTRFTACYPKWGPGEVLMKRQIADCFLAFQGSHITRAFSSTACTGTQVRIFPSSTADTVAGPLSEPPEPMNALSR
jgi:hypothetical protein